jgi:quercetin dioxygenase-like cupin family protein
LFARGSTPERQLKEENMRANVIRVFGFGMVMVSLVYIGRAAATPSTGFTASTIAVGRFGDIDVNNHSFFPSLADTNSHPGRNLWLSMQKTKGPSDVYVQSNTWVPGGTSGWHTHPGHSLIIVTAGTVTGYHGDDPTCTPHEYTVGEGFVDEGGDHVHLLRNEGSVDAKTVAVQLIPAGATRRIDAPA